MSVTLSAFGGVGAQFFDNNGNPLTGGKIFTYAAGTTTPLTTYTTNVGNVARTNPIILDAAGRVPGGGEIWVTTGVGYKFVLTSSTDVLIATYDNVPSSAPPVVANDADFVQYEQGYTVTAGSFVVGKTYQILTLGDTNFIAIGATSNTVGTYFVASGVGSGTGTARLSQTVAAKLQQTISVKDFGAVGNGVTNDRPAIIAAIAAVKALGGGSLLFPEGEYIIDGVQQSVNTYQLDANIQYVVTSVQAQIYVQDLNNTTFNFDGAVLKSTRTAGGYTLLFDGCSNLTFNNLNMVGASVKSGPTITVNGTDGIGFICLTQNSKNITLNNTSIQKHFGSVDLFGDPASAFSVSNVTLSGTTYLAEGKYGISCRGSGQAVVVENLYSFWQDRGFFLYDTENVSIKGTVDFNSVSTGFSSLVKAYTTNTTNIKLDVVFKNKLNLVTPRLAFQSSYNPGLQPDPAYLENIFLRYTEINCGENGLGIRFGLYENETTLVASTNKKVFDNFTFVGNSQNLVQTDTTLTSSANVCNINLDNFYDKDDDSAWRGKAILNDTGFVGAKRFTYTPSLNFNGNSTGMTYSTQSASYYVQSGFCTVLGRIVLSAKGSSTGNARIIMPYYTREDSNNLPIASFFAENMSGLTAPIQAYVQASSGNTAILFMQGATGTTNLTHANFTDTSDIYFQVTYPV